MNRNKKHTFKNIPLSLLSFILLVQSCSVFGGDLKRNETVRQEINNFVESIKSEMVPEKDNLFFIYDELLNISGKDDAQSSLISFEDYLETVEIELFVLNGIKYSKDSLDEQFSWVRENIQFDLDLFTIPEFEKWVVSNEHIINTLMANRHMEHFKIPYDDTLEYSNQSGGETLEIVHLAGYTSIYVYYCVSKGDYDKALDILHTIYKQLKMYTFTNIKMNTSLVYHQLYTYSLGFIEILYDLILLDPASREKIKTISQDFYVDNTLAAFWQSTKYTTYDYFLVNTEYAVAKGYDQKFLYHMFDVYNGLQSAALELNKKDEGLSKLLSFKNFDKVNEKKYEEGLETFQFELFFAPITGDLGYKKLGEKMAYSLFLPIYEQYIFYARGNVRLDILRAFLELTMNCKTIKEAVSYDLSAIPLRILKHEDITRRYDEENGTLSVSFNSQDKSPELNPVAGKDIFIFSPK